MSPNNYPKGSEWRKWDLHVHTPASFHWNGGCLLRDMDVEEKNETFSELLTTIEESDVEVFCFTDYWTFDGYLQFLDYLEQNELYCSKTIFPGIELRIEAPVDYRLNIQVILSDKLSEEQLMDFYSRLIVRSLDRRISEESIKAFARTLDKSKARKHGFSDPETLGDNDLLRLGSITIEVTKSSLEAATKAVPPATAYIVLPFDTTDGLKDLDWETQPHADNYFMQSAHAFESRSNEVANLFMGIKTRANAHFIANFQKTLNFVEKPVICGSDAHKFSDYGTFPNNRITWIKANPTFQGFRQIFFEPRERVRIQRFKPEEKTPYLVIDKVRFIEKSDEKFFQDDWIELNDKLNTIIGGKSSGKSLLLYHIVKAIAPDVLELRGSEIKIPNYKFGENGYIDFEVIWKNGQKDRVSKTNPETSHEIEYIPQMYVNSLAEKEGRNSLYRLIDSILEQNSNYREFVNEIRDEIRQCEMNIDEHTTKLIMFREQLKGLYSERREIGDEDAIEKEINRLVSKIDVLRKESGFTEEEEEQYTKLQKKRENYLQRKFKYESLNSSLFDLIEKIKRIEKGLIGKFDQSYKDVTSEGFSERVLSSLQSDTTEKISKTFSSIENFHSEVRNKAYEKGKIFNNKAEVNDELLKPYKDKIENQRLLKKLTADLELQKDTLVKIQKKNKEIQRVIENGTRTKESLIANYFNLFDCYKRIVSMLRLDEYSKIDEEMILETTLSFDTQRFLESFSDLFDRRFKLRSIFGPSFDEFNDFQFEKGNHIETVVSIYEDLNEKKDAIQYKQDASIKDAIRELFKNYFLIDYNIRYKGDDILEMSPGKKGLVLLQLILHISNSTHPILLDQPEDNLDNRTISNELKNFIKSKKLSRQIIMVTHDANLVVLTDSENVIVSNQAGQQPDRENVKYRFEYVNGALENSFRIRQEEAPGILLSCGIREHVCDILEGGEDAFRKREQRYGFLDL